MATRNVNARADVSPGVSRTRNQMIADLIDPPGLKWKRDPVAWCTERAGLELWSAQRRIIESVRDNRQTAVHSCHEIGKSFIAATATAWWVDVHPPGEAFVVTTAPSDKQVKAILWREINKLHARIGLPGRTNLDEWYIGREMVAFGRKPADHDPTAFQGLHARHVLVILDEACGIPKELWDAASTLGANKNGRTLAIGNPDDPHGEFAMNCRPNTDWNVIHVGYRDTPNFTGENVSESLKEMLIHPEWVAGRAVKWGRESAIFTSKCEGLFPKDSEFGVVPYSWATACRSLQLPPGEPHEGGIDVGGGGDRTVIRERHGMKAGRVREFIDSDPMRTVGRIVETINEWGLDRVKVDSIGIGWGIYGRLEELSWIHNPTEDKPGMHNAEVVPINFGEAAEDPDRFLNKRAEVWWTVGRERSRLRTWDLEDVDDDTIAELTNPGYVILDSKGKIKIEAKDEVIKRMGRSPDGADALLLAFIETSYAVTVPDMDEMAVDLTRNLELDWTIPSLGGVGSDRDSVWG
jgi:hypothetical protein